MGDITGLGRQSVEPRKQAIAAARLGAEFISAVRAGDSARLRNAIVPGGPAALQLELFGTTLFRAALRLDDPQEQGKLTPYDFQVEGETGLLELGVLEPLPEGEGHLARLFGSCLVLQALDGDEWLVEDLIPVNTDGAFNPDNATDQSILEIYQGRLPLPLQKNDLDPVEQRFLTEMQRQEGRYNLEELLNAVRLWRDFKATRRIKKAEGKPEGWAAGVEYLVALFDYFQVDSASLAQRYGVTVTSVLRRAREIAQVVNATQFDDRYSIHPDPIAHYREVFKDIGGRFNQAEMEKAARERDKVFDTIEVPPDDTDFYGPD